MAQNFSEGSEQGSILVGYSGTEEVTLRYESGEEILSFTPSKSYNSILISCPELRENESYIIECGDSRTEITLSGLIYGGGGNRPGGFGGPGGMGGSFGDRSNHSSGERPGDFAPEEFGPGGR